MIHTCTIFYFVLFVVQFSMSVCFSLGRDSFAILPQFFPFVNRFFKLFSVFYNYFFKAFVLWSRPSRGLHIITSFSLFVKGFLTFYFILAKHIKETSHRGEVI